VWRTGAIPDASTEQAVLIVAVFLPEQRRANLEVFQWNNHRNEWEDDKGQLLIRDFIPESFHWMIVAAPGPGAKGQQGRDLAGLGGGMGKETAGGEIGLETAEWALFRAIKERLAEISNAEMAAILGLLFEEWRRRDKAECEARTTGTTEGTENRERNETDADDEGEACAGPVQSAEEAGAGAETKVVGGGKEEG